MFCPHCGNDTESPVFSPDISLGFFELFWKAYPRHVARVTALSKWKKLRVNESLFNKIMAALEEYKKTDQWKNPQYIPHPATWLNQQRWNDDILPPTEEQKKMRCTIEGDQAWYDEQRQVWKVKTYAGVWCEYGGSEKPVYTPV